MLREVGVLQDVSKHVYGKGHVLGLDVREEGSLLARGVGVEAATHVLDLHLERAGGAAARALEDHMLEEMRGAVGAGGLETAAGVDPDSQGGGVGGGRRGGLSDDAEAGGKGGEADLGEAKEGRVVGEGSGIGGAVLEEARVRRSSLLGRGWAGGQREVSGGDGGESGRELPPSSRQAQRRHRVRIRLGSALILGGKKKSQLQH